MVFMKLADVNDTSLLLSGDHSIQQQLQEVREDDDDAEMTHSVKRLPGNIADAKINHCGGGYHSVE